MDPVVLGFCYESMYDDKRRTALLAKVDEFVTDQLLNPSHESKVRCVVAITTLLQNATEVGQAQVRFLAAPYSLRCYLSIL